jgi:hypothetical protein
LELADGLPDFSQDPLFIGVDIAKAAGANIQEEHRLFSPYGPVGLEY